MKQLFFILLFSTTSITCWCQRQYNKFTTADYMVEVSFADASADSSLVQVLFKNKSNRSVLLPDGFAVRYYPPKKDINIQFGEQPGNNYDSSQVLNEIKTDSIKVFRKYIARNFNSATRVTVWCNYIYPQHAMLVDKLYVRKDFPQWEDHRDLNYSFLINCK